MFCGELKPKDMGQKNKGIQVDVSKMSTLALLKLFETEWQDHFQSRRQTWQALQVAALLTVAVVGIQWKAEHPIIGIISSALLIGVSFFGMQITYRHRNSVEKNKFTVIIAIEKRLHFKATGLGIPRPLKVGDIFAVWKSNTSLFLLRMQFIIFVLGITLLILSIIRFIQS